MTEGEDGVQCHPEAVYRREGLIKTKPKKERNEKL